MPHHRAASFAKALEANPRFEQVDLKQSRQAKGACYYVTFRPVSEARQAAIERHQQETRQERALAQGGQYLWCRDEGFVWCLSTSGEVYQVTPSDCTCPDFAYRCRAVEGMSCKHQMALFLGLGQLTEFDLPQPEAVR
jgi:hypothetical protein